jgi:hypothetical protein
MHGAMTLPIWVVALFLAAIAPFAAKFLAAAFERWARERSRQIVFRGATSPVAVDESDERTVDDTLRTN